MEDNPLAVTCDNHMISSHRVIVRDFDGNVLSSFWQYGLMDWDLLYTCLDAIIFVANNNWAIFHYDEHAPGKKGALCPADCREYPTPGTYILLMPDGSPISVYFVAAAARPRFPTTENTEAGTDAYQRRVRDRDPCCLISGLEVFKPDFIRFKATHIFPRAYDTDWIKKGYPSLITDPAPLNEVGGSSKIDSIQNMLHLRSDLYNAWNNYRFAVSPDRGYVIIPFVGGYDDIAGKVLKLDHIEDPNHRPLDILFRDHFLQRMLRNMKGAAEPTWEYDYAPEAWDSKSGKGDFDFLKAARL